MKGERRMREKKDNTYEAADVLQKVIAKKVEDSWCSLF